MKNRLQLFLYVTGLSSILSLTSICAQEVRASAVNPVADYGRITGRVANEATKEYLRDALVEIKELGLSVRTDEFGYYTLSRVPAGTHTVSANYMGLDESKKDVAVNPRQSLDLDFDLTSAIYRLDTFVVKGESEGNAAALMRQQSSDNIKNVVAFGGQGGDVTETAADTLIRLPGIAGVMNDEGSITGIYIRGFADMDIISVDGSMAPGSGSMSRNSEAGAFSGAIFDEIEVVKGMTPDMPAGSLSGAVNIKTKNILNMKQKRRVAYDLQGRWAATPLWDYIPMREDNPIHPYFSLSWQEIFSVLGGRRNLGVSLGVLYRGNANGSNNINQVYEQDPASFPSYMYDISYNDSYNFRERVEGDLKFEYRISSNHTFYLSGRIYNDHEKDKTNYRFRVYTDENAGGSNPHTDDFVTVTSGVIRLDSIRYSFKTQNQDYKFGGKHQIGRFHVDYQAAYSNSHSRLRNGEDDGGGYFNTSITGASWTIDKTGDDYRPYFQQTGGADAYTASSYGNGGFTRRDGYRDSRNYDLKMNLQYAPDFKWKTLIKTGAAYRSYHFSEAPGLDHWRRRKELGYGDDILTSDKISYADLVGGQLSFVDTEALVQEWKNYKESIGNVIYTDTAGQMYGYNSRAMWFKSSGNIYDDVAENLRQTRSASEDVGAVYLQGNIQIRKLTIIAGLRAERTEVEGFGYERSATNSTATDQHQKALDEWNNPKTNKKSYSNYLPSIHFNYEITKKWKLRASWSTTMGRPALSNYTPALSYSNYLSEVTLSNPDITPQKSQNIDVELSYALPNRGLITLGLFRKDITDFIYQANLGPMPAGDIYEGYDQRQSVNGDKAKVNGLELAYTQSSFSFLPRPLRGLGCFANLTLLDSKANYRSDGYQNSTDELAGFVEKTFNAGLSYRYKKFYARINVNYTGEHLLSYSDKPNMLIYKKSRIITSLRLSYDIKRYATAYVNVWNIFNEPLDVRYQARESQPKYYVKSAPVIEFGIRGNF